jgi:DNA-binding NtrC family response regulator
MNLDLYPEPSAETVHRILVVDDEESLRMYAVEALAIGGYQATAVDGGNPAMQALRAAPYDLVLTDFNMPNGSGGDLIIKMHQEGFTMPVIMMTGGALNKELLALISMLHVEKLLQKPFKIDELLDAVELALRPAHAMPANVAHHDERGDVRSSQEHQF